MAKKKTAKKPANGKKSTNGKKTTSKQRKPHQFQPGNKIGHRFKKGDPGGPGRPISIASPRAQLKRYAEEVAPEKLRNHIKKLLPDLDVSELTWAQVIALVHLSKSAEGDMAAIVQSYKQIDDSGVDKQSHEITDETRRAAEEFTSEITRIASRVGKK